MSARFAVLRPEPGNARTAALLLGHDVLRLPLFAVRPVDWTPPDPAAFDALLLTSANAVRHGGAGLTALRHLPVIAVGNATAEAARQAGFRAEAVGDGDAAAAAALGGARRLLHLAGRDRIALEMVPAITVYTAEPVAISAGALASLAGRVALLHSPRAARRLGRLIDGAGHPRGTLAIAALSPAVATAAGTGWRWIAVAPQPTDDALVACAIDRARCGGNNPCHD